MIMITWEPIIGVINESCALFIKSNSIGYTVSSGDYTSLADSIRNIDIDNLKAIGKHAKEIYLEELKKCMYMNKLID